MAKYVTIIDPRGATVGYTTEAAPISHRALVEGKQVYGYESMVKLFDSHVDLMQFLSHAASQPVGTTGVQGELQWSVE